MSSSPTRSHPQSTSDRSHHPNQQAMKQTGREQFDGPQERRQPLQLQSFNQTAGSKRECQDTWLQFDEPVATRRRLFLREGPRVGTCELRNFGDKGCAFAALMPLQPRVFVCYHEAEIMTAEEYCKRFSGEQARVIGCKLSSAAEKYGSELDLIVSHDLEKKTCRSCGMQADNQALYHCGNSCDPNCGMLLGVGPNNETKLAMQTKKGVKEGEKLTISWNWNTGTGSRTFALVVRCDRPNCSGELYLPFEDDQDETTGTNIDDACTVASGRAPATSAGAALNSVNQGTATVALPRPSHLTPGKLAEALRRPRRPKRPVKMDDIQPHVKSREILAVARAVTRKEVELQGGEYTLDPTIFPPQLFGEEPLSLPPQGAADAADEQSCGDQKKAASKATGNSYGVVPLNEHDNVERNYGLGNWLSGVNALVHETDHTRGNAEKVTKPKGTSKVVPNTGGGSEQNSAATSSQAKAKVGRPVASVADGESGVVTAAAIVPAPPAADQCIDADRKLPARKNGPELVASRDQRGLRASKELCEKNGKVEDLIVPAAARGSTDALSATGKGVGGAFVPCKQRRATTKKRTPKKRRAKKGKVTTKVGPNDGDSPALAGAWRKAKTCKHLKLFLKSLKSFKDHQGRTVEDIESTICRIANGNKGQMYGRMSPMAVHVMCQQLGMQRRSPGRFLDIGHGIGTICMQVARTFRFEAIGIEIDENRHKAAEELLLHCEGARDPMTTDNTTNFVPGRVTLMLGDFREEQMLQLVKTVDVAYCNNFGGVMSGVREDRPGKTSLEDHVAVLFGKMKEGGVLVTLNPIEGSLKHLPLSQAKEIRRQHKLCGGESDSCSFYDVKTIGLGQQRDVYSWSQNGGCDKQAVAYMYTRVKQSADHGGSAVFMCNNPICQNAKDGVVMDVIAEGNTIAVCGGCRGANSRSRSRISKPRDAFTYPPDWIPRKK